MTNPPTKQARDACPHCGRPVGLDWWNLLPSRDNNRVLTCKACGGHFDLANASKMASIVAAMLGMAFAMFFPFEWIVKAGHGTKTSIVEGIVVAALTVGLSATTAARLTLRLESKSLGSKR
jgi:hypothetical protein